MEAAGGFKSSLFILITIYCVYIVSATGIYKQQVENEKPRALPETFFENLNALNQIQQSFKHAPGKDEQEFTLDPFLYLFKELNVVDKIEVFFKSKSHGDWSSSWQQDVFQLIKETLVNKRNATSPSSTVLDPVRIKAFLGKLQKDPSSSTCAISVMRLALGVATGKQWAANFLDSSGKPGPSITQGWVSFVGNYDQCTSSKAPPLVSVNYEFSGQYCNLPILFSVAPFPFNIGMCVPSTCSSQQLTPVFKDILALFNVTVFSLEDVQCLKKETSITPAAIIALVILSVFGSLVILGTWYDITVVRRENHDSNAVIFRKKQQSSSSEIEDQNKRTYENTDLNETEPLIQQTPVSRKYDSRMSQILVAFSCYTNGKRLLSTATPKGSIPTIHGLRFLSTGWIALGHTFAFGGVGYAVNLPSALQTYLNRWTFDAVMNCLLAVDTFFTISGLLVSYITIKQLWSRGLRINWPMFYFHRYWRLTPPYLCALVIVLGLQKYLGEGALWKNTQPMDKEACEKYWWANVLYINNFFKPTDECFIHCWYLAVDFQFYLISPLLLIPLYYSRVVGLVCCGCVLLASWITTGVLTVNNGWGITVLSGAQKDWMRSYYTAPWCRIGPYVIGIITGYILAVTDGKPFRIRRPFVVIGWLVSIASALAVIYGIEGHFGGFGERPEESNPFINALYNALSRSVWSACVSWIIIACTAGYGGPVHALLSWSPFVVLGRLSFMIYLFHIPVLSVFFGNMDGMYYLNDTTFAILYLGLFVITTVVAFVGVLLFETPMTELEKVIFRRPREKITT